MLPREVRCRFFQARILHLQLADAALQLPDPLIVWHIGRQRLPREFLPVCLNPEPERGIVDIEFPRHLGESPRRRGVDHFLDGLLLELRSVMLRFPRHLIPSFPVRILLDPLSGKSGAPQADLLARGEVSGHPADVAATLGLALSRLAEENPAAAGLMRLLAFLAP